MLLIRLATANLTTRHKPKQNDYGISLFHLWPFLLLDFSVVNCFDYIKISITLAPEVPESCLPIGAKAEDGNTQLVPVEIGRTAHTYTLLHSHAVETFIYFVVSNSCMYSQRLMCSVCSKYSRYVWDITTPVFLISTYGAILAQRTSYLALHSSLFGPVNYNYIITKSLC